MKIKIKWNPKGIWLLGIVLLLLAFNSNAQPVTQIAAGYQHTLFLKGDGSLWAMGNNNHGQLGDGTANLVSSWPEMILASNVTAIAAGIDHSLFLKRDGSLWGMGGNYYGQLGDGTTDDINHPEMIVPSNVKAIAVGKGANDYPFSLFLKTDGSLWAMGNQAYGQLGDGVDLTNFSDQYVNVPEQIVPSGVAAIAVGNDHALFLKSDGSLWAMGDNSYGQLGDGSTDGDNYWTNQPEQIVASGVAAIAAGPHCSLFLKSDGSLWAMGDNANGQLGNGVVVTNGLDRYINVPEQILTNGVKAIAADIVDTLLLKSDGNLWALGENSIGQLGSYPFHIGNGGPSATNVPQQIVSGVITTIAAGYQTTFFIKSDGSLWGVGDCTYGQLGLGLIPYRQGWGLEFYYPVRIVTGPPGFNLISGQLMMDGEIIQLSFVGIAGENYVLDRSFSLSPPNWIAQATNAADSFGALVFTNKPNPATNNFWRVRSMP